MSRELGVNFRATSGPVIAKAGDLAALLTNLEERDVLFIDEIHRLNPAVEEILYPAMEDFQLDLIIGEGPAARSVKIDLSKFTLVGATTRAGLLTNPLRDRFGIPIRLNFYTEAELELIVNRGARVLGIGMTRGRRQRDRAARARHAAHRRAAVAPRARLRPCRRRRQRSTASSPTARCSSSRSMPPASTPWTAAISRPSRRTTAAARSASRRIAAALSEPRDAIEEIIEPFLIQKGFMQRTPRGRLMTAHAFKHLGLAEPRAIRRSSACLRAARMTPSESGPMRTIFRSWRTTQSAAAIAQAVLAGRSR